MWRRSAGERGTEGQGDGDVALAEGVLGAETPGVGVTAAASTGKQRWRWHHSGDEGSGFEKMKCGRTAASNCKTRKGNCSCLYSSINRQIYAGP
jgi:hypothetical protein